jgi:cell division protein FtsN
MNQVSQLVEDTKTVTVFEVEAGKYLVDYMNTAAGEEGYFVQAGYFSTQELADAKAAELLAAESISGEMLVGDVVSAEPEAEPVVE